MSFVTHVAEKSVTWVNPGTLRRGFPGIFRLRVEAFRVGTGG